MESFSSFAVKTVFPGKKSRYHKSESKFCPKLIFIDADFPKSVFVYATLKS